MVQVLPFGRNLWLICYLSMQLLVLWSPRKVCKLEKCHVNCQKLFRVDRLFDLRKVEDFGHKRHAHISFSLWWELLIRIILADYGISGCSEVCVGHEEEFFATWIKRHRSAETLLKCFCRQTLCLQNWMPASILTVGPPSASSYMLRSNPACRRDISLPSIVHFVASNKVLTGWDFLV